MQRAYSSSTKDKQQAFILILLYTALLTSAHIWLVYVVYSPTNDQPIKQTQAKSERSPIQRRAQPLDIPSPPPIASYVPSDSTVNSSVRKRVTRPHITTTVAPTDAPHQTPTPKPLATGSVAVERTEMPLDSSVAAKMFFDALEIFDANLGLTNIKGNPEQPTKEYMDIDEEEGRGVPLPYNTSFVEDSRLWQACDPRNASFSKERDALCTEYLSNTNNMRSIKALSSRLLNGRTIKMKVFYAHNNIQAIVKLSQRKFYYEASSEVMAYTFDRALQFHRVPTTVFMPIPLDYLRVATAYSPLFSQWFQRYIVAYNYTNKNFVPGSYFMNDPSEQVMCTMAAVQLWMKDVHPALETFLALPYEYDNSFAKKYFIPGHDMWTGIKKSRLRAVGELLDRFIFDFLIGNTDRGMNDHNNFVYGGCSARTTCVVEASPNRIKGLAKYAYIDHGSSLYSHKEPQDNPFFGEISRIHICRFRRSTYTSLKRFVPYTGNNYPLIREVNHSLPPAIFNVTHDSVIRKVQARLDKIVLLVDNCLKQYPEEDVFSIPEYDEVRIAEEDATLDDI